MIDIPQEAKTDESSLVQIIRPPEEPGGTVPLEIWLTVMAGIALGLTQHRMLLPPLEDT